MKINELLPNLVGAIEGMESDSLDREDWKMLDARLTENLCLAASVLVGRGKIKKVPRAHRSRHRRKSARLLNGEDKTPANDALKQAVRDGDLIKPRKCSGCGRVPPNARMLHGHHPDYADPLAVKWLCTKCHGSEHQIENMAASFARY